MDMVFVHGWMCEIDALVAQWYSKKKGPVEKIALQCTECKQKNYTTEKNRRNTPNKLELMKYCPFEHKHTLHRETKIK